MLENFALALVAFGLLLIPALAIKVVIDDIKTTKKQVKKSLISPPIPPLLAMI